MINLDEFLQQNNIKISDEVYKFCQLGIKTLKNAKDPLHSEKHPLRMLTDLGRIIEPEKLRERIDFELLVTSIIWHDVWRGRIFVTNPFSLIYSLIGDGLGGAVVFYKAAKKFGLSKSLIKDVSKIILLHSDIAPYKLFRQRRRLETRILIDLDSLDIWSESRMNSLIDNIDPQEVSIWKIRLAKVYMDWFMLHQDAEKSYHLNWAKEEFAKRRARLIRKINELIDIYRHELNLNFEYYEVF
jgi:hypothetical protein